MSEFSIKTIVEAGRRSLQDKNYWSALMVALSLPSMCARVEYSDEKYKGIDRQDENGLWYEDTGGNIRWNDKRAYIKWCKEWMVIGSFAWHGGRINRGSEKKDSFLISLLGEDYAEKYYELRCNILHEAETDIDHGNGIPIFFSIGFGNTTFSDQCLIEIEDLCETVFGYAEAWLEALPYEKLCNREYFNHENGDDVILFNKIHEEKKAERLLDNHNKELERRKNK